MREANVGQLARLSKLSPSHPRGENAMPNAARDVTGLSIAEAEQVLFGKSIICRMLPPD